MKLEIENARLKKGYTRRWVSKGIRYYVRQKYKIIDKLKSEYTIVNLCKKICK